MRDEFILSAGFLDPFLGGDAGLVSLGIADRELVHRAHEFSLQIERHVQDLFAVHEPAIFVTQLAHDLVCLHVHDIAGRDSLASAVRLNSTGRSMGFLAGPAVGSVLLLALGPAVGIFANVLM